MRTVFGFAMLFITVAYFVLLMVFAPQVWALEPQLLRIGVILGWCVCIVISVLLLKKRSDILKDKGFLKDQNGKLRLFKKVPVTVLYARDLSKPWIIAMEHAIDHINSRVGFRLLLPPDMLIEGNQPWTPGINTIKVRDDNGINPKHGSTTFYPLNAPTQSALITAPEQDSFADGDKLSWEEMVNLMIHEFGHSLGLEHDETKESVMWPILQERPRGLTDSDIARFVKAYKGLRIV